MSETTAREAAGTDTQERGFGSRLLSGLVRVREVSVLIVLVGLALYFQAVNGAFLSQQNLLSPSSPCPTWSSRRRCACFSSAVRSTSQ